MTVSLRTARLLLRPWHDEDVAAFTELSADPAVMEYLVPLPGWVARTRAHWDEHDFGQWVVEIPGEASFIGQRERHVDIKEPAERCALHLTKVERRP